VNCKHLQCNILLKVYNFPQLCNYFKKKTEEWRKKLMNLRNNDFCQLILRFQLSQDHFGNF